MGRASSNFGRIGRSVLVYKHVGWLQVAMIDTSRVKIFESHLGPAREVATVLSLCRCHLRLGCVIKRMDNRKLSKPEEPVVQVLYNALEHATHGLLYILNLISLPYPNHADDFLGMAAWSFTHVPMQTVFVNDEQMSRHAVPGSSWVLCCRSFQHYWVARYGSSGACQSGESGSGIQHLAADMEKSRGQIHVRIP